MHYRIESDSLGSRKVPAGAYYGVQTVRALENFQITDVRISRYPRFIQALVLAKEAAALTNMEMGLLEPDIGGAIVAACRDARDGRLDDQFVVDVIQGGAGTSTNMNANEVICNRALEILGLAKGDYERVHPNNHVNLSQSTNDVYPTAMRVALVKYIRDLKAGARDLTEVFAAKGTEFANVIKMGRTQLQDAVPMTLGQEFTAWGVTLAEDLDRLSENERLLCEVNLGATAIGTGINTVAGYAPLVCEKLSQLAGLPLSLAPNLIEATSDTGAYVMLSGILKRFAVKLSKICNDLRLLSSGPFTGLNEITLPPVQPGSTIMPGKVNPVIPEVVNQVCYAVVGNDMTITMAAEGGQLELNVFVPLIAVKLFESLEMLRHACATLKDRCLAGIKANPARCLELVSHSAGVLTALTPRIGYERAAQLVKKAQETNRPIDNLLDEAGLLLGPGERDILKPQALLCPRVVPTKA